jgi:DNA-binding response OmpR family regulator
LASPLISNQQLEGVSAVLAGTRVFLVEDEPVLLWALEDLVTDLGCQVVGTAARVSDALAFALAQSFDVAVMDGTLPDGKIDPVIDVLIARGTPVIIASGTAPSEWMRRYSDIQAVQKPYEDAALSQALLVAISRSMAQAKLPD